MTLKARLILWYLKALPEDSARRRQLMALGKIKLNEYLKEDNQMEGKAWFESKTVWVAIVGIILGGIQPLSTAIGHPIVVPQWIYEVLAGLGLYSLRDGQGKPLQ